MGFLRGIVRQLGEAETGVQRRPGEDRERAGETAHSDGGCGREESREGKESAWRTGKERWKGWGHTKWDVQVNRGMGQGARRQGSRTPGQGKWEGG